MEENNNPTGQDASNGKSGANNDSNKNEATQIIQTSGTGIGSPAPRGSGIVPPTVPGPVGEQPSIAAMKVPEVPKTPAFAASLIDLSPVTDKVEEIRVEVEKFIIGQYEMVDLLLIGIFTGGHILLEGVPGVAKTLTARVISKTLSSDFSRIQFTPDLMPSDIIGTSIFNMKTSEFSFRKGPIFSNVVLIDEISKHTIFSGGSGLE